MPSEQGHRREFPLKLMRIGYGCARMEMESHSFAFALVADYSRSLD